MGLTSNMEEYRTMYRVAGWWGVIDCLSHALRLPSIIQDRICDRFEQALDGKAKS